MAGAMAFRMDGWAGTIDAARAEVDRYKGEAFTDLIATGERIRAKAVEYAPKRTGQLAGSSFTEADIAAGTVAVGFSDFPPKAKWLEARYSYLNRATREVWSAKQ